MPTFTNNQIDHHFGGLC